MGGPGSGGQNKISRENLLRELAELQDQLDEVPRLKDWREQGDYTAKALYNEFENWNVALDELDMEKHHVVNKDRLSFTCDGPDCDEIVKKTPVSAEQSDRHYCSQECHYAHKSERYSGTGNPQSTLGAVECAACEREVLRPRWKRDLNDRHYCSDCWGDSAVEIECEVCGETDSAWPTTAAGRRFCSYGCMGEWRGDNITGSDHPRWRGGYEGYYGASWPQQRAAALRRDQARCQDCGLTDAEHARRFDESLTVHHIDPVVRFRKNGELNEDAAHQLENLVSLCRPCHSHRETQAERTNY